MNRSIYFLCLAQVVNSVGHFVQPFLTMFFTQKMGMSPVEAGTYVMLSAAAEPVNDAMITDLTQAEQRKTAFSLPLQLAAVFRDGGPQRFGTIMSFNAVVVIVLTTFVIHTTERIKPALTVAIASLFFAVGFGITGYLRSLPLFFISTLIWTVGEILQATNASVYVANHSPITHRGRFNAIAPIIMWSEFGLGPPLSAQFIKAFNLSSIWPLCFALSLLGAALLFVLHLLEQRTGRGEGSVTKQDPAS